MVRNDATTRITTKGLNPEKLITKKVGKRKNSFNSYIKKMIKFQSPETTVNRDALGVFENILKELRNDLTDEMFNFADRRKTIKLDDVKFATKRLFPGQLGREASQYASEAVTRYIASKKEIEHEQK
jgi:histone H3/H4